MFNKDNTAHVAQVKQGQVECLGSLSGKDDVTFRSFRRLTIKLWPLWLYFKGKYLIYL